MRSSETVLSSSAIKHCFRIFVAKTYFIGCMSRRKKKTPHHSCHPSLIRPSSGPHPPFCLPSPPSSSVPTTSSLLFSPVIFPSWSEASGQDQEMRLIRPGRSAKSGPDDAANQNADAGADEGAEQALMGAERSTGGGGGEGKRPRRFLRSSGKGLSVPSGEDAYPDRVSSRQWCAKGGVQANMRRMYLMQKT